VPRPETRKVERPPYDVLMAELAASNYSAVGRKYGVSDNAVRKWVRWYEQGQGL
jgi:transposase-like protein